MHVRIPMVPVLALQVVGSGCGTTEGSSDDESAFDEGTERVGWARAGDRPETDALIDAICGNIADCYDDPSEEGVCRAYFQEYVEATPGLCDLQLLALLRCYAERICTQEIDAYDGESRPRMSPDCDTFYYAMYECSIPDDEREEY